MEYNAKNTLEMAMGEVRLQQLLGRNGYILVWHSNPIRSEVFELQPSPNQTRYLNPGT
jgi:hypothetical protein